MNCYKHILLALDLHPENDQTTEQRALQIQQDTGAKISLIHAVEHITNASYGAAFAYPILADLEGQLLEESQKQLALCGARLAVATADCHVKVGVPKMVLLTAAKQLNVDLIIVGSHTRHGFHLLFGSTVNAILHEAPCDVLAVRLVS